MRLSLFPTLLLFSLTEFALAGSCNKDNCLNAMNNHPSSASAFCTPYLAATQTATTGIPSFLKNCKASTSRLSSACSCILTSTANTATSPTSSYSNTQLSCTATATITASGSTITTTVTSNPTCPSIGATNTITSVSTSTTTATVTTTVLPSCFPRIVGGDFTSNSQNLAAFTVTQTPPGSIFYEVLVPSAQEFVVVSDGTPQFLFLNYVLLPISTAFTLAQDIGTLCAPYTSITLSATIDTQVDGATISFCINPTTCSTPQNVPAGNGNFVEYAATIPVPPGTAVTASMNLAVNNFTPQFFAGIGNFRASPS